MTQDNLIALEMKKSTAKISEKEKDRNRLKALTRQLFDNIWKYDEKPLPKHVCRYILGIYYELDITSMEIFIEYYKDGILNYSYTKKI